ncbi:MAG: hypothetical protein MR487_10365 [Lachnospiraceae bacterium]|nr:hypothetical protein [Lachnospiraceae bacterium]
MAIIFQCESERFHRIMVRIAERIDMEAAGYSENSIDAVSRQVRAVYESVRSDIMVSDEKDVSDKEDVSDESGELLFSGKTVILSATEAHNTPMDRAIYSCLALRRMGLHPVLIRNQDETAVGVWYYKEYDMGEARIRTEEFMKTAEGKLSMLLPVSMNKLSGEDDFSEAVSRGCEIVGSYIEAIDIRWENGEDYQDDFQELIRKREFDHLDEEMMETDPDPSGSVLLKEFRKECPDIHNGKELAEAIVRFLKADPYEMDSRCEFRMRRYKDALDQRKGFLKKLNEEVLGGVTLADIMKNADRKGESRLKANCSPEEAEILFSDQSRFILERYAQAWDNCRYRTPDGRVCFDLTMFSVDRLKTFFDLLRSADCLYAEFCRQADQFGKKVCFHEQYHTADNRRTYLKQIMMVCELLLEYGIFRETAVSAELPEATVFEKKDVDEYRLYRQCRNAASAAAEVLKLDVLKETDSVIRKELINLAESVLNAGLDSIHIPISRDLTENSRKLQEKLQEYGILAEEKILKLQIGTGKNQQLKKICQGLVQYSSLDYNWCDERKEMIFNLFGDMVSENGYLFGIQIKIAGLQYMLMKEEGLSAGTRELINWLTDVVGRCEGDSQLNELLQAAEKLYSESYLPFHDMEKEIFRFLDLSYVEFDEKYTDRMLIDFIREWLHMLEEGSVMQECRQAYTALLRNCFGQIMKQIRELEMSPSEAVEEFDKLWYHNNSEKWVKVKEFDRKAFDMNLDTIRYLSESVIDDCCKLHYNKLLQNIHDIWDEKKEILHDISQIEALDEIFSSYEDLMESSFEALGFTMEKGKAIIREQKEFFFTAENM